MNDFAPKVSTLGLLDRSPNHVCHICSKSFARRDVLRRHARHQHGESAFRKTSPRSRRKSCLRCALHKVKCTRESTCQECGKSGLLCQYNFEPSLKNVESTEFDSQLLGGEQIPLSSPKGPRPELDEFTTSPERQPTSTGAVQPQALPHPPSLENRSSPEWGFTWNREFGSDIETLAAACPPNGVFGKQTTIPFHHDDNDITQSSENHGIDSHGMFTPLRNDSEPEKHPDFDLEQSGSDHGASEHWGLLFDMEDPPQVVNLTSLTTSESQMPELSDGAFPDFTVTPDDLAIVDVAPHQTSGTWLQARQPLNQPLEDRQALQNHKEVTNPFVADPHSLVQEDIYASISGSANSLGPEDGREPFSEAGQSLALRIHQLLQQSSIGQIGLSTDVPSAFPSSVQLSAFWDLYFTHFDKHCPILHRHLVKPMSCSPLIAAVVTVVGANYAETAHGRLFHQQGASKLCALLQTSTENDGNNPNVEGAVLAAVCILLCQAIRSRKSDQVQLLTTLLDVNISHLEKIGLFRQQDDHVRKLYPGRTIPGTNRSIRDWMAQIKQGNDREMHQRWLAWVKEETSRRLAWAYLTCNYLSAASLHNRFPPGPKALDLQMPCEDIMWEAENARAWSTCFPWSHNPPLQLPFRATLRGLLHQTVALHDVSRFGRLVCAALIHYELCRGPCNDESERRKGIAQLMSDGGTEQMLRLAADLAGSFKRDTRSQL